jgi:hypothetical protein
MKRLVVLILLIGNLVSSTKAQVKAHFVGSVVAEWITEDESKMQLTKDFAYVDTRNFTWYVPSGTIVDGASIPRPLWSIVGSPFTGEYRRASVVHDYYCDRHTQPWEAVHRMFYDACLTGGVSEIKSKIMYMAVYSAGPRWRTVNKSNPGGNAVHKEFQIGEPVYTDDYIKQEKKWIEENNPSLQEIEKRAKKNVKVDYVSSMVRYNRSFKDSTFKSIDTLKIRRKVIDPDTSAKSH